MQFKVITRLFALAVVCLSMVSCSIKSETQSSTKPGVVTAKMPTDTAATIPSTLVSPPSSQRPFEVFEAETRSYLYEEKFALLDSIASKVRASKERFPGGAWKLNAFYTGVSNPVSGDTASDSQWEAHLDKLGKWLSQYPDSITAHVALGDALVNYAWHARGQGFSNTVTQEGWQAFGERLAMAQEVLGDARRLNEKCPHWYVAMLRIGQSMSWETASFDKLFDEAVAFEPTYYYYHRVKATHLLPRWNGKPGEWERFADEASRKVGGKQGAILYYMITSHMRKFYGGQFFEQNQVSWPRIKEGYDALAKTYGTDWERRDEVCRLAAMAHETMEVCHNPIRQQP